MELQTGSHSVHRSRSVGGSLRVRFFLLANKSYVHRRKVDGAFLLSLIGHSPFALEENSRKPQ